MEKEIIWTDIATKDFWNIVSYLDKQWPEKVLDNFYKRLTLKINLVRTQPILVIKAKSIAALEKHL